MAKRKPARVTKAAAEAALSKFYGVNWRVYLTPSTQDTCLKDMQWAIRAALREMGR